MFKLQYGVVLPELNTNGLDEKLAAFLATEDAKRSVRNVFTGIRITRGTVYTIGNLGYKSFTVKDEDTGKTKMRITLVLTWFLLVVRLVLQ